MGARGVVPDFVTTSLDAAKAFYGDVLGLQPVVYGASSSAIPMGT